MNRRNFLQSSTALGLSLAAGALVTVPSRLAAQSSKKRERPPRLDAEKVEAFVRVAHADLAQVREMLAEEPGLVNATWDWGGGDFETALGGASHMGEREIALYLLEHGARMDLFAAAMLGRIEIVRAALTLDPAALHVPGPHNIPLVVHAEKGGEAATEVLAYLRELSQKT